MGTPRPTLPELAARSKAEVDAKLEGAEARLYRTPEGILAEVAAGHAHGLYGRLERAERQLFPQFMDDAYVDEALVIYKVSNGQGGFGRIPAKRATGKASFTGSSAAVVAAGTEVKIGDVVYTIDSGYTYPAAIEDHIFNVTARDAGSAGNADDGAEITLATPIANVVSEGTVTAGGLTNGAEQETLAAAKVRLLEAIAAPGTGGARGDFKPLAKAASSLVTEAWELPRYSGAGTMLILLANDNEDPPQLDPTTVTEVLNYIQTTDADGYVTGKGPTSAIVSCASVFTKAFEVAAEITLDDGAIWEDDDGNGTKRNIEVELAAFIAAVRKPKVTITVEEVHGAIQRAPGVKSHNLTQINGGAPADVTHTDLQIPYVGTHNLTKA